MRPWERWNHLYIKGQALLELAVFGSILLTLLGILISYGLKNNYQQRLKQQAFRKAMSSSYSNKLGRSDSYMIIKDVHIPSPLNPFGVGSVIPVSGQSNGAIRSYDLQQYADNPSEALNLTSKVNVEIQGVPYSFTTAGARSEANVPTASVAKYKIIYGEDNVFNENGSEVDDDTHYNYYGEEETTYKQNLTILDPVMGQIVDYNTATGICRRLVDKDFCKSECEKAASTAVCVACNYATNPPNQNSYGVGSYDETLGGAWYCAGADNSTGKWSFPEIDKMFPSGIKTMGLQQDYSQKTRTHNTLIKNETSAAISTSDSLDWNVQTKRKIITANNTNPGNLDIQEPATDVGQNEGAENHTRTTSW